MSDLERMMVYSQKSECSEIPPSGIMFTNGPESMSLRDHFHWVISRRIEQGERLHISRNLRQSGLEEAEEIKKELETMYSHLRLYRF